MPKETPSLEAMLPPGIRSRMIAGVNGLDMHILEAGFEEAGRPLALLAHGYPELAFSWRHVMLPLAAAGYHVVAPDLRGFGRTTGGSTNYDCDLLEFGALNKVRDMLALVFALGHDTAAAIIGHDLGSHVVAWCALVRPDVFRAVAMMSAPFGGPPSLPFNTADAPAKPPAEDGVHRELAALPRPRKHYQWYYSTREADRDMHHAPQGVHDFMRAYYHHKSADWKDNKPYPLKSWTADEIAKLPTYYVMDLAKDMAAAVAEEMPSAAEIAANTWLPDSELAFYAAEYGRNGFQGGLQWYRGSTTGVFTPELQLWSGRTIDIPSAFISGKQDWGTYQRPGVFETMQTKVCTNMIGCHLVDGAGHWVQQEQPGEVSRLLVQFLQATKRK